MTLPEQHHGIGMASPSMLEKLDRIFLESRMELVEGKMDFSGVWNGVAWRENLDWISMKFGMESVAGKTWTGALGTQIRVHWR